MSASGRITRAQIDCTSRCPLEDECEWCLREGGVDVATMETSLGVLCQTLCDDCVRIIPEFMFDRDEAERLVVSHCEHLDITVDEMTAALKEAVR